jgi:DNA-directed RNA polymerase I, II, and III subunit RPABC4
LQTPAAIFRSSTTPQPGHHRPPRIEQAGHLAQTKHLLDRPNPPPRINKSKQKMSREEYQIPTAASSQLQVSGSGGAGTGGGGGGSMSIAPQGSPILYSCGDCGYKFELKRSDPIRCTECGCRVLYKNRTNR